MRKAGYQWKKLKWGLPLFSAALLVLFACNKATDLKPDYGVSIAVEQKDLAMDQVFGSRSLADVKTGEWTLISFTQALYTSPPQENGFTTMEILSKEDQGEVYLLKVLTRDINYKSDGTLQENKYEDYFKVSKGVAGGTPTTPAYLPRNIESSDLLARFPNAPQSVIESLSNPNGIASTNGEVRAESGGAAFSACMPFSAKARIPDGYHVSYHNIKTSQEVGPPPDLVKNDSTCQGIPNCTIHTKSVNYDEVVWDTQGNPQRYHCVFRLSEDVPYLSHMLNKCIRFLATVSNRKVPVEICMNASNFKFGK